VRISNPTRENGQFMEIYTQTAFILRRVSMSLKMSGQEIPHFYGACMIITAIIRH
jgi:hypothetical protein